MIQQKVFLRKEDHRYFDFEGQEYTAVSRVLDSVKEKFDEEKWSKLKAKKLGISQDEMKSQWKKAREDSSDHGTRIHDALEHFTKHGKIDEENLDLTPVVKSVANDHREYTRVYSENECILYHPDFMVAGMCDKILITGTRTIYADIEDYKTNLKRGIEFSNKYNNYMLGCVSHLQDCNFNRYALQLSIYALMYESLTKNRIRNLWIRHIPAGDLLNHRRIIVPYLRTDALHILEDFCNTKTAGYQPVTQLEEPTF